MDTPDLRTADKTLLALALQDARNYTISLLDDWAEWKDRVGTDGVNLLDPRRDPGLAQWFLEPQGKIPGVRFQCHKVARTFDPLPIELIAQSVKAEFVGG